MELTNSQNISIDSVIRDAKTISIREKILLSRKGKINDVFVSKGTKIENTGIDYLGLYLLYKLVEKRDIFFKHAYPFMKDYLDRKGLNENNTLIFIADENSELDMENSQLKIKIEVMVTRLLNHFSIEQFISNTYNLYAEFTVELSKDMEIIDINEYDISNINKQLLTEC